MKNINKNVKKLVFFSIVMISVTGLVLSLFPSVAAADIPYDFTEIDSDAIINGAYIQNARSEESSGTGQYDSFLRISANKEVVQGFNSDGKNQELQFDEDHSWTESFLLSGVPVVPLDPEDTGTVSFYREFRLDINQQNSYPDWLITLDELEVYVTAEGPNLWQYTYGSSEWDAVTDFIWELDFDDDNHYIIMNYTLAPGSGGDDLYAFIPDDLFPTGCGFGEPGCTTYVVLYTRFGGDSSHPNNDGFEEWGVYEYDFPTKSGYKYEDRDGDGDISEDTAYPLEGWTIYVDYNNNSILDDPEPYAVTDTNGYYLITGIVAGNWTVREVLKDGWTQSYPPNGYYFERFEWGMDYPDNNFGNYQRGCMEIAKAIDWGEMVGDPADVPDVTFEVIVTGPSYTAGHSLYFDLIDGVIDPAECLCDLIPGSYTVTEPSQPSGWSLVGISGSPFAVAAGSTCDGVDVTVTNEPILGCIEVAKAIDWGEMVGDPADVPDVTFEVIVTGPSYTAGHSLYFDLIDGVIDPAECLCDLIPGSYTVTEPSQPSGWSLVGISGSPFAVAAGSTCDGVDVTVTNEPILGCLQVNKTIDWSGATPIDGVTFEICITGPSYPSGDCKIATYPGTMVLEWCNLIPGEYNVSETDPGENWMDVEIIGSPADVPPENYAFVTVNNTYIPPGGCTYTPGYWKTHSWYGPAPYDPTWSTPGPDTVTELQNHTFFDTSETWLSIMSMKTTSKTKTYQQLAFHYVAAYLNNIYNGQEPLHISENMSDAETILDTYDGNMEIPKKSEAEKLAKNITSTLSFFNEGCVENWPHCDFGTLIIFKENDGTGEGIPDWEFTIATPCDTTITRYTNSTGYIVIDLSAGYYTVTEELKGGWVNVTPLTQMVEIPDNETIELTFINAETVESASSPSTVTLVRSVTAESIEIETEEDDEETQSTEPQNQFFSTFSIQGKGQKKGLFDVLLKYNALFYDNAYLEEILSLFS